MIKHVQGDQVSEVFRKHQGERYYNIIDTDARANTLTMFTMPDALKAVSLNEIYKDALPESYYQMADKVAHYLLVSQPDAITLWHTDFSGTSVLYILMKGEYVYCKINASYPHLLYR